jgi:DNA polymerase III sliding clamp (beta) subunit (PCNA family)
MRFRTADLVAGVRATAPAVTLSPTSPHLAFVHAETITGGLRLRTTDGTTWITTRVDEAAAELIAPDPWTAQVSHRALTTIAGVIRAKEVEVAPRVPDRSLLRVTAGRSYWDLPIGGAVDAMPWPNVPPVAGTIDAATFAELVDNIASAASSDGSTTPPLNVVEMVIDADLLTLNATDRYRIHTACVDGDHFASNAPGRLAVYPHASMILRTASALSGTVSILAEHDGFIVALDDGRTSVIMRTIGVTEWLPVTANLARWSTQIAARTSVRAVDLADAVRAAAATMPDDIHAALSVDVDGFTVTCADPDTGARSSIDVDTFTHDGQGLDIVIAPRVLAATLATIGDADIVLGWTGPGSPALIHRTDAADAYVVMPITTPAAQWKAAA